jgi:hypothetical protein
VGGVTLLRMSLSENDAVETRAARMDRRWSSRASNDKEYPECTKLPNIKLMAHAATVGVLLL